jgi:hypothetical protein
MRLTGPCVWAKAPQPHSKSRNTRLLPIRRLGATHRLWVWLVLDVHALVRSVAITRSTRAPALKRKHPRRIDLVTGMKL